MNYGITVNTSYEVPATDDNRDGLYGRSVRNINTLAEAEAKFGEMVAIEREQGQPFTALLLEYQGSREPKTIRRASEKSAA